MVKACKGCHLGYNLVPSGYGEEERPPKDFDIVDEAVSAYDIAQKGEGLAVKEVQNLPEKGSYDVELDFSMETESLDCQVIETDDGDNGTSIQDQD